MMLKKLWTALSEILKNDDGFYKWTGQVWTIAFGTMIGVSILQILDYVYAYFKGCR